MYDSGIIPFGNYTCLFSGHPSSSPTRSAHGVAICLDNQATAAWRKSGSTWEAVSERIIYCRLSAHPVNIFLISIYAPINSSNQTTTATASDTFYLELQKTIDKANSNDMILLMGDFNAQISKQQHQTASSVVGPHAIDELNENGQRLIDFCSHNDLIISNTFFEHKLIHKTSWMHAGSKKWHMIDYTLINRKFRSSVEDVRVLRSCIGSIGTDHHLLRTKLKFHLKSRRKGNRISRSIRLDKKKLQHPIRRREFQEALSSLPPPITNNSTCNERYKDFIQNVNDLSQQYFAQDRNSTKRKEWMTNEILNVIEKKAQAFQD